MAELYRIEVEQDREALGYVPDALKEEIKKQLTV